MRGEPLIVRKTGFSCEKSKIICIKEHHKKVEENMDWRLFGILLMISLTSYAQDDVQCEPQADLFFVIDGSDSLSDEDFADSKNFVIQVLKEFNVQRDAVHVGANVFGTDVTDRIQLHGPTKIMYRLFEKRIETLSRFRSGTATFKAIREMREEFELRGRDGVTKIGIVITDGKSVNSTATRIESALARDNGIFVIAIGVGDRIFRPELENIASSKESLFETDDINDSVGTIQDAIKSFLCTVITTAPSTTNTVPFTTQPPIDIGASTPEAGNINEFDCKDCMIDGSHGFWNHPHSCEKYIEIIASENGSRINLVRKCRDGLFWDQYHSTCRRPEQVICDIDPCLSGKIISYNIEGLCSGYILCVNKRSTRACCPPAQRYVPGTGCDVDPSCIDSCDGDDNHLIHPITCDKTIHPTDNRFYIQDEGEGHTPKTLQCAPGTVFNTDSCMCDLFDTRPLTGSLTDCSPAANFTFDGDFADTSGNHAYAGTELVEMVQNSAKFSGNGMMNIYRFSMDDFAQKLVLRVRFNQSTSASGTEALVTNCVYSAEQGASISIKVNSDTSSVSFSTDTELGTASVSVPFTKGALNEAIYIYDGQRLYGIVDDGSTPRVQSANLEGDILMRKSGIILGAGSQMDHFNGIINEFQLYKCFPGFAESYRTP